MSSRYLPSGGKFALRGRGSECERLDRLLGKVRGGHSEVLLLWGEAGVGKTALIEYAVESAKGFRIARVVGMESEVDLPYAALHQLCAPMLGQLERLPGPQRDALGTVFGLSQGVAPDRFLVGLAVLSLLSEAADDHPLLCAVDDAQWLDRASAQTLGVVARRLLAESVALLFAAREPLEDLRGSPELQVQGLHDSDAAELLQSVVPGRLDARVSEQIVAETRGNPLALLELPGGLSAAQLAGGFAMPRALPVPNRVEESFQHRVEDLPEDAQLLLLIAAADPVGDPSLVWRAAERLQITPEALAPAEVAGLLEIDARVRFRHPLVRSAAYRALPLHERQRVHGALASVTDPEMDPDRRAWHRAQATSGPDEDVAEELERSAGRARARGGLAAAAAFLERSSNLTLDPTRRTERMLAAAQFDLQAGALAAARRLLVTVAPSVSDEFGYARVDLLRGRIASAASGGREAPALLLKAARRLEGLDPALARDTYLDAWAAALFAGPLAEAGNLEQVSEAARAAFRPTKPLQPPDLLLEGLTGLILDGRAAAVELLRRAVTAFGSDEVSVEKGLGWGTLISTAAATVWDFDSWTVALTRQAELAREAGALALMPIPLHGLATFLIWCGEFDKAGALIAEIEAITKVTGTRIAPYGAMLLAAYCGPEPEAVTLIQASIKDAIAEGEGLGVQYAHWATAVLYNGLGHYDRALAAARLASEDTPELFLSGWALVEFIEAAIRSGEVALGAAALERLAETTRASGGDWGRGVEARSRAMLSQGDVAEGLYREAIDRLGRTRLLPEVARTQLVYGEWLRRQNQRVDARKQLRSAYELFTSFGAEGFAERARHELLATGETVRKRRDDTRSELTPQEEHVARLARHGRTNPQIGAELFLSPRTVEWHLRKVYTKLGIASRSDLQAALPSRVL
jgi:DNA-binding CsgD family transcriptional regulator